VNRRAPLAGWLTRAALAVCLLQAAAGQNVYGGATVSRNFNVAGYSFVSTCTLSNAVTTTVGGFPEIQLNGAGSSCENNANPLLRGLSNLAITRTNTPGVNGDVTATGL
jgi:hypothetical protein